MNKTLTFTIPVLLILLFAFTNAQADTIFVANLTTSQEPMLVPPTTVTGAPRPIPFGFAVFVLNDAMTELRMTATVFNLDVTGSQTTDPNDNLMAAHIHAGTTATPTWPVVWGFFGTPDNDNNPDDLVLTPFTDGVGGVFASKWDVSEGQNTTLTAQLLNIFAGRSYLNFHTVQNPGGEIRGQIQAVPEPATMLILGTGLAGIGMKIRKRRKSHIK